MPAGLFDEADGGMPTPPGAGQMMGGGAGLGDYSSEELKTALSQIMARQGGGGGMPMGAPMPGGPPPGMPQMPPQGGGGMPPQLGGPPTAGAPPAGAASGMDMQMLQKLMQQGGGQFGLPPTAGRV